MYASIHTFSRIGNIRRATASYSTGDSLIVSKAEGSWTLRVFDLY